MMKNQYHYEIYNVFAESAWGGNPLAIVPDADALSTEQMQLIARQFNLSETVFICSSKEHTARLRIFTPDHEMPFAGHPTIGAAAWLHKNRSLPNQFTLMTNAKMVEINHDDGIYHLSISGYQSEPSLLSHTELAQALDLSVDDVAPDALDECRHMAIHRASDQSRCIKPCSAKPQSTHQCCR
jgi:trans-2,3-dihydro-3-hydroxyanthranilate isomerase